MLYQCLKVYMPVSASDIDQGLPYGNIVEGFIVCQANHRAYLEQTSLLTNQPVFDHDDSVNNRETGGRLETAFLATSQIWTRKFKEVQPLGTP